MATSTHNWSQGGAMTMGPTRGDSSQFTEIPSHSQKSFSVSDGGGTYAEKRENLKKFFGEPQMSGNTMTDSYEKEYNDYPEAFKRGWATKTGPNGFSPNNYVARVLIDKVTASDNWALLRLAPWCHSDGLIHTWIEMRFNRHMLDREPEESTPRLLTSRQSGGKASLTRYGIALMLESNFAGTELGAQTYVANMEQIRVATVETASFGALISLLEHKPFNDGKDQFRMQGGNRSKRDLDVLFRHECSQFAIFQKENSAFDILQQKMTAELQTRNSGVDGDVTVIPHRCSIYSNVKNGKFYLSGIADCAQDEWAKSGKQSAVIVSRTFAPGDHEPGTDPMVHSKCIGSFQTLDDLTLDTSDIKNYRTDHLNSRCMDESDDWQIAKYKNYYHATGIWDFTFTDNDCPLTESIGRAVLDEAECYSYGHLIVKWGHLDNTIEKLRMMPYRLQAECLQSMRLFRVDDTQRTSERIQYRPVVAREMEQGCAAVPIFSVDQQVSGKRRRENPSYKLNSVEDDEYDSAYSRQHDQSVYEVDAPKPYGDSSYDRDASISTTSMPGTFAVNARQRASFKRYRVENTSESAPKESPVDEIAYKLILCIDRESNIDSYRLIVKKIADDATLKYDDMTKYIATCVNRIVRENTMDKAQQIALLRGLHQSVCRAVPGSQNDSRTIFKFFQNQADLRTTALDALRATHDAEVRAINTHLPAFGPEEKVSKIATSLAKVKFPIGDCTPVYQEMVSLVYAQFSAIAAKFESQLALQKLSVASLMTSEESLHRANPGKPLYELFGLDESVASAGTWNPDCVLKSSLPSFYENGRVTLCTGNKNAPGFPIQHDCYAATLAESYVPLFNVAQGGRETVGKPDEFLADIASRFTNIKSGLVRSRADKLCVSIMMSLIHSGVIASVRAGVPVCQMTKDSDMNVVYQRLTRQITAWGKVQPQQLLSQLHLSTSFSTVWANLCKIVEDGKFIVGGKDSYDVDTITDAHVAFINDSSIDVEMTFDASKKPTEPTKGDKFKDACKELKITSFELPTAASPEALQLLGDAAFATSSYDDCMEQYAYAKNTIYAALSIGATDLFRKIVTDSAVKMVIEKATKKATGYDEDDTTSKRESTTDHEFRSVAWNYVNIRTLLFRASLVSGLLFKFFVDNDIPVPIALTLWKPNKTYRTGCVMRLQSGDVKNGGCAQTYWKNANFMMA